MLDSSKCSKHSMMGSHIKKVYTVLFFLFAYHNTRMMSFLSSSSPAFSCAKLHSYVLRN